MKVAFLLLISLYVVFADLDCTNWCKDKSKPVIVVGAGISGLAAARTLTDAGCAVVVLEARNFTGGRMHTEKKDGGWVIHIGANWIHGAGENPIWLLNQKEKLVRTQWLPRTYYIRSGDQVVNRVGNDTYVPGEDIRNDFANFYSQSGHYNDFVASVANGTYSVPDVPFTYYVNEYIKARNLTGEALDELYLFDFVYNTLDEAWDLFDVGFGSQLGALYAQDKENMVAEPGYTAITDFLATGLDIRLNVQVNKVQYGTDGVVVSSVDGNSVQGSVVIVTVPAGVLKADKITFDPELEPWKYVTWHTTQMGLLDKLWLQWDSAWWPNWDAFWRVRAGEMTGRITANEWYNIYSLNGNESTVQWPPILLCTPAGYYAEQLENMADADVQALMLQELQTIFPNISIPAPKAMYRTKWNKDPYAYGSYVVGTVGADPLLADYAAEPASNRVFFAGEHTALDLRTGYVDGAYVSGMREANRILNLCPSGTPSVPYVAPQPLLKPANDATIRQAWANRVSPSALITHLKNRASRRRSVV